MGLVAAASAFVHTAAQLYVARFLLGVAEAGFFPGIIIYSHVLVPDEGPGCLGCVVHCGNPCVLSHRAPVSTWIMDHVTGLGLSGWRWMLLLEGVPAILGGVWCYFFLTDAPEQAKVAHG